MVGIIPSKTLKGGKCEVTEDNGFHIQGEPIKSKVEGPCISFIASSKLHAVKERSMEAACDV